ncbi:MAG TPA: DUF935 family protein [Candidatus Limnocylindrales bacterium]|nr:DUF935 family protein [Candidatus Limnocylindrales bacterium]
MMLVVRPNVRDRWLASQLSYFTPQIVENTVRGAMAGNLLAQWLMFDLMEQTWPRLNKNLNELKNAVIDLDWNLQPFALRGDKPSAEATRRRKVIEQALWLMRPEADADEADFEDTIYDVLDAVGKGIAVSEIDWMAPGDPDNQTGLWMPRATKWVHPRYYGYPPQPGAEDRLMLNMMEVRLNNPDADAALEEAFQRSTSEVFGGLPQSGNNSLYARFPRDQFIISIIKQKSGHPISSALLRILGFWWAASNFSWEWFLNLAQIFGVPLRWANYDSKAPPDTISGIKDMMANLGSAGWAVFPEGVKINIEKALEAARDNPNKAFIDAADIIADTLILGQTLTTSQGERGSQALGTIHKDVRDEKIHAVAKRAAKILNNQFLPSICRMNFGDARECPWFQPSSKQAKDVVGQATRYKTLLSIPGIRVSEDQFYEDNDLVRPDPDDPVFVGQATGGFDNSSGGDGSEGDMPGDKSATAQGKSAATDKLIDQALENLTGVEAKWLAGVKPFFRELMAKAKDAELSDADFAKALVKARSQIPELFGKLDTKALAKAMEETMASAVVNGALKGHMARGGKK